MEEEIVVLPRVEINEKVPYVLICVYGTLRMGEGNYKRFLQHTNSEYLGTFNSEPRFTMYGRRAGFPILTDKGTTSIVYEVFKVKDPVVLERLHDLEGCSGTPKDPESWYDITSIDVPTGKDGEMEQAWIYLQHSLEEVVGIYEPIVSGDWKHKSV